MKKILAFLALLACFANPLTAQVGGSRALGPHLLVYKMRKDYSQLVPVILSDDKTRVISYPDPKDITEHAKPTKLHGGYYLDNRGIGKNVAFLKWTYADYQQLGQVPPPDKLYKMITDKKPLLELYDLGLRSKFRDPVAQVNKMIDNRTLRKNSKVIIGKK